MIKRLEDEENEIKKGSSLVGTFDESIKFNTLDNRRVQASAFESSAKAETRSLITLVKPIDRKGPMR